MNKFTLSILTTLLSIAIGGVYGQNPRLRILETGQPTNLRGLSSLDAKTIWVSGSGGMIGLSKDGGKSWSWQRPAGFNKRDFRDIEALGGGKAVALLIDTPAIILQTKDRGTHWKQVYTNDRPEMFLDALDFAGTQKGIIVGDPVAGHAFMARTHNGGDSWQPFAPDFKEAIRTGEAFFAASGSNIQLQQNGDFILVSGGTLSRLWLSHQEPVVLPFQQGNPTAGPNGMDVQKNVIAIVGGDYTRPELGDSCFAISYDSGKHFQPENRLPGYGSDIAIISDHVLIACGLKGVWLTKDGGKNWVTISSKSFNTLQFLPKAQKLLLAGPKGTIAELPTTGL